MLEFDGVGKTKIRFLNFAVACAPQGSQHKLVHSEFNLSMGNCERVSKFKDLSHQQNV